MLKSSLCDQSDAYIFVSGTRIISNKGKAAAPYNRKNIKINNCAPFTDCISELINTKIDNVKTLMQQRQCII